MLAFLLMPFVLIVKMKIFNNLSQFSCIFDHKIIWKKNISRKCSFVHFNIFFFFIFRHLRQKHLTKEMSNHSPFFLLKKKWRRALWFTFFLTSRRAAMALFDVTTRESFLSFHSKREKND